jgi:hypothetical protein
MAAPGEHGAAAGVPAEPDPTVWSLAPDAAMAAAQPGVTAMRSVPGKRAAAVRAASAWEAPERGTPEQGTPEQGVPEQGAPAGQVVAGWRVPARAVLARGLPARGLPARGLRAVDFVAVIPQWEAPVCPVRLAPSPASALSDERFPTQPERRPAHPERPTGQVRCCRWSRSSPNRPYRRSPNSANDKRI